MTVNTLWQLMLDYPRCHHNVTTFNIAATLFSSWLHLTRHSSWLRSAKAGWSLSKEEGARKHATSWGPSTNLASSDVMHMGRILTNSQVRKSNVGINCNIVTWIYELVHLKSDCNITNGHWVNESHNPRQFNSKNTFKLKR